jgi:AraC-like DNA-binding protein
MLAIYIIAKSRMQNASPLSLLAHKERPTVLDYYFYEVNNKEANELVEYNKRSNNHSDALYELISPDGIHFWYCNTSVYKQKTIVVENPEPFFHLNFVVRNNSVYKQIPSQNEFATFDNYEYNLLYFPAQQSEIEWRPSDCVEAFEINLTPAFLRKYLPEEHPFSQKMGNGAACANSFKISDNNLLITPQIMAILLDILNCPLERQYKRMFLKAKVIELLSIVLSHLSQFSRPQMPMGLRDTDVRKMQEARELLHANLKSPCSLIDLAHQVGTNENYLKKQFKILYGNTVYGYIHDLRMQQARIMLKENKELLQIAQSIGYKNVHHFASAFKKYFGYSPYSIRK